MTESHRDLMTDSSQAAPEVEGYEIAGAIGEGSMGVVYSARHAASGQVVALKVLHHSADRDMALERFRREVELVSRIRHPAIPGVYDAGQLADGRLYLVMEMLEGESLEQWWDKPGKTRLQALELLARALQPLEAAHATGVVHRDLKPENVFVTSEGEVKLLDFGIAREVGAHAKRKTATGVAVGTPAYMSPEQATQPSAAGPATDVWSFGVMVYEALCGELPIDGETPQGLLVALCTQDPVPLPSRAPHVHSDLVAFVNRCLNKEPHDRDPDAAAMRAVFGDLLARDEVRATLGGPAATPELHLSSTPAASGLAQGPSPRTPTTSETLDAPEGQDADESRVAASQDSREQGAGPRQRPWPARSKWLVVAALGAGLAGAAGYSWSGAESGGPQAAAGAPVARRSAGSDQGTARSNPGSSEPAVDSAPALDGGRPDAGDGTDGGPSADPKALASEEKDAGEPRRSGDRDEREARSRGVASSNGPRRRRPSELRERRASGSTADPSARTAEARNDSPSPEPRAGADASVGRQQDDSAEPEGGARSPRDASTRTTASGPADAGSPSEPETQPEPETEPDPEPKPDESGSEPEPKPDPEPSEPDDSESNPEEPDYVTF